MKETQPT